ncbi:hypothetical protein [Nocardia africana]
MNRRALLSPFVTISICLLTMGVVGCGGSAGETVGDGDAVSDIRSVGTASAATSVALPGMAVPGPSHADARAYFANSGGIDGYYFTTPTGRWHCAIIVGGDPHMAGCQAATHTGAGIGVKGAPTVENHYSHKQVPPDTILIERGGEPRFAVLGQAVFRLAPDAAKVLPYNTSLSADGFTCTAREAGVSCGDDVSRKAFTFSTEGFSMN